MPPWQDSLAQLEEHNTFNVGVLGSSPRRITEKSLAEMSAIFVSIKLFEKNNGTADILVRSK